MNDTMTAEAALPEDTIDPRARDAAERLLAAVATLDDRTYWAARMFANVNLFLWHLDAF